jgi:hypothetical protein
MTGCYHFFFGEEAHKSNSAIFLVELEVGSMSGLSIVLIQEDGEEGEEAHTNMSSWKWLFV